MRQRPACRLRRTRSLVAVLLAIPLAATVTGCGGKPIEFRYPGEQIDFSLLSTATPTLFVDIVRDLRPAAQRQGEGRFFGITFPRDEAWRQPVVQIYRDALVQDLTQTHLVDVVPLLSQADYTLAVDIVSLGARLQRNVLNFLVPLAAGIGAGMVISDDTASGLKTGLAIGVLATLAIPTPTGHRAECEVRMTLRDRQGEVVWERACLGEVDTDVWTTATSRDDQGLVDKHLTAAVKRCNACLLGQLRQALLTEAG